MTYYNNIMQRLSLISSHISNYNYTKLSIYYQGSVGYISMRSPKDLNCLSNEMFADLSHAFIALQKDSSVNVIVVVSELAKIFCAGADINEFVKRDYQNFARTEALHVLSEAMRNVRKPVIAAVNGKALGGGFQLALMCDIIVATEKSYFGFPQINLGLMPGMGGTQRLTKLIGDKKAMKIILTGGGFTAKQAFKLNIAEQIPSQKFNEEVQKLAELIASKALMATMIAKKTVKQGLNMGLQQGLDFEKGIFYSMIATKAAKEGTTAFINKKKPNFKGL